MKGLLVLSRLQVENANAVSGLTYGFPSITHFLGFTHALSRRLSAINENFSLTGCSVVCHKHQVHQSSGGNFSPAVFSLTRNPLTKEGGTAPFNEEARMHMTVSLIIECDFNNHKNEVIDNENFREMKDFESWIKSQVSLQRLAGGSITSTKNVSFYNIPDKDHDDFFKKNILRPLMPGFLLVDRNELLLEHYEALKENNQEVELLDAWLDFVSLQYQAEYEEIKADEKIEDRKIEEEKKVKWVYKPKPALGWLVPISIGYKAISPIYSEEVISGVRDSEYPFQFVEMIHSIGQWIGLHRIRNFKNFKTIFWRYHYEKDWYLCKNNYID
jgi:CRISPR-associated protein Csy2